MAFFGKTFKFVKHEKFDEFLAALDVPQQRIDDIIANTTSVTIEKNGDTYTQTLANQKTSFKSGVEFEESVYGKPTKTICVFENDTLTQTQKYPDGGPTITYKKKFSDDKLVVEATNSAWDGVAYRYYSA